MLELRTSLDHLIVGASDLMRGVEFVEQRTGVRPAFGGVHPGRGTRNSLLSLGPQCYLEILAPDPEQNALAWFPSLPQLTEPRLVGWMIHPSNHAPKSAGTKVSDLESLAQRLRSAGIRCGEPSRSSRLKADGRTLRWKLLRLEEDCPRTAVAENFSWRAGREGLLPILIEWDADSPHPAADAPSGCRLINFEICSPERHNLQHVFEVLGLDLPVSSGEHPRLSAYVGGPQGVLELSS